MKASEPKRSRRGAPRRAREAPRIGAFFDMDKTLIAENSGAIYMRHRFERGEIRASDLAKGLADYARYKLGVLDLQTWASAAFVEFAGQEEAALAQEVRGGMSRALLAALYPEAREQVEWHHAQGHLVAIVSGSIRYFIAPLAEAMGIDEILCTELEVVEGRFSGRLSGPVCLEDGKVARLEGLIEVHGIDLAKSYFYSDSVTDLPLLELVGHPVVTNPDPMLDRIARKRGWPVRRFAPPGPSSRVRSRDP
jgi:HAD superfamily hydrolase (TIGR01490 family)